MGCIYKYNNPYYKSIFGKPIRVITRYNAFRVLGAELYGEVGTRHDNATPVARRDIAPAGGKVVG